VCLCVMVQCVCVWWCSVKLRQETDEGMSCAEFLYPIFQAYDFLHLHRHHDCWLQVTHTHTRTHTSHRGEGPIMHVLLNGLESWYLMGQFVCGLCIACPCKLRNHFLGDHLILWGLQMVLFTLSLQIRFSREFQFNLSS